MKKTLQELCLEVAGHADVNEYSVLAYLLRVAAAEAERSVPLSHRVDFSLNAPETEQAVGVWDVDVSRNLAYFDAVGADFFGQKAVMAAQGVSVDACIDMIHPDDVGLFAQKFDCALRAGGAFTHEYRVIANNRVRWMHADGTCTLDQSGRPARAIGLLVDITGQKEWDSRCVSIVPH